MLHTGNFVRTDFKKLEGTLPVTTSLSIKRRIFTLYGTVLLIANCSSNFHSRF